MEQESHQNIKCKLLGEVKNYRKNCVNTGKRSTTGAIEVMLKRSIITCIINPTDKKLTLKPNAVISRLKLVPHNKNQ